jgi:hypothetical protein
VTVAVAVQVWDGVVIAADSATTLDLENGSHQVYNNANKVFHLHRRRPLGAVTWGLGNIGSASIASIAKDLRHRLMGLDKDFPEWEIPSDYSVRWVTEKAIELFHGLYKTQFSDYELPEGKTMPAMGFMVSGYSAGAKSAETWGFIVDDPVNAPLAVEIISQNDSGWNAQAQYVATKRLFEGIDPILREQIRLALPPAEMAKIEPLLAAHQSYPAHPAMPFADAVALCEFLVSVTAGYSHFLLGPDIVGGPVEVAAISRHEGFKWIKRKHYYPQDLNPEVTTHAS